MARNGENIYKRKDGRWEGRYIKKRQHNGKIIYGYIYGQKYKEVKQQLFQMKLKHYEQYLINDRQSYESILMNQWLLQWLEQQKSRVRPNTYSSYQSKIKSHILPLLGDFQLNELNSERLHVFFEQIEQVLSKNSVNGVYRVLNTCLREAVKQKLLYKNPLETVPAIKQRKPKVLAFSQKEQDELEQAIQWETDFPIIFALYTGLRISELVGLRWEDIHWENHTFVVQRNAQPKYLNIVHEERFYQEASLKTKQSYRVIPIGDKLYDQLDRWQKDTNSAYLFSNQKGDSMEPRTLRYRFQRLKKRAGISNLPFHALRHTFATRCIERGVPITTVSSLLGHQSVKMTLDVYTNSFLSEKRAAIKKLEQKK